MTDPDTISADYTLRPSELAASDIETTARYAHLARGSILDAAERIAGSIATDIL